MKIVTYNLRYGSKDRVHWREVIRRFDPELLLVQESFVPAEHLPRSSDDVRCGKLAEIAENLKHVSGWKSAAEQATLMVERGKPSRDNPQENICAERSEGRCRSNEHPHAERMLSQLQCMHVLASESLRKYPIAS